MIIKHLHESFIAAMKQELPEWKYVASRREFNKVFPKGKWIIHIAFINHPKSFDAVVDVAVEFLKGKNRLCIIGASLGNIESVGQVRYSVTTELEARAAVYTAIEHIKRVGLPFLEYYSSASNVIATLEKGGREARSISPLENLHAEQIAALAKAV